jgi:hypothetical protein
MKGTPIEFEGIRGFSEQQAARYTGLSTSFLQKARTGITALPGPKFKKIGKRVVYLRDDLDAFLDNPPE